MPTLEELKAQNAAEAANTPPEPESEETLDLSPEETPDNPEPEPEEDAPEATAAAPDDAFTPEEDDGLPKDGPLRKGDAKALRQKYQGKLSQKDEELERVRQELEEVKKKVAQPSQLPAAGQEPQRDQYTNDAEWIRALTTFNAQQVLQQSTAQQQAEERRRKQEEIQTRTRMQTDAHYERVADLAKKSNISEDVAKSADLKVRNAVDAVFKGAGDTIVDTLISSLGPGSEKVILHLGIKNSKLNDLVKLFQEDPSGIKASAYLGSLKAELNAPTRRETKAPDPIDKVQGDKSGSSALDKMRKDVADARKKGDISKVIALKQQAKAAKMDTRNW
jgi:hypothetical protein